MFGKLNFKQNRTLANGSLPQMNRPVVGWSVPLTLVRIIQSIVEGDIVTTEQKINFQGVWQPLRDESLQFKPENERSWSWYWIHAVSGTLDLNTGDKIIFQGKRYKVMAKKDYSLYAYVEYQVILDYQDN